MQVNIEGLEDHIEEVVRRVLAEGVEDDPWLDAKRSAAYLGISDGTIRNLVHSGCAAPARREGHEAAVAALRVGRVRQGATTMKPSTEGYPATLSKRENTWVPVNRSGDRANGPAPRTQEK
jgi:hypothetical protein